MTRSLSHAQAANCEHAQHPRCACRCGGRLHGAARIAAGADRAAYAQLPPDDPHALTTPAQRALLPLDVRPEAAAVNRRLALPVFSEEL